ncbi:hypothetical protein [Mycoplasma sp. VS1572C]
MKPLGLINNIPLGAVSAMSAPIGGVDNLPPALVIREIDWDKINPINNIDLEKEKALHRSVFDLERETLILDYSKVHIWVTNNLKSYLKEYAEIINFTTSIGLFSDYDSAKVFAENALYVFYLLEKFSYSKENISYLYLFWFEKEMYENWNEVHLLETEILSGLDDDYETEFVYIVKNLSKIKEAYSVIEEFKKEKKYLCLLKKDEKFRNNVFLQAAGIWYEAENTRKLAEAQRAAINTLKSMLNDSLNYFENMRNFLTHYYNKFNSLKAGNISTSVISWLTSVGFVFLDLASGGALTIQAAASIVDSILRTESAADIAKICNELNKNIVDTNKSIEYLNDMKVLSDTGNIAEFITKIHSLKEGFSFANNLDDKFLQGYEVAEDFFSAFIEYKIAFAKHLGKHIIKGAKLAFKNTKFAPKLIEIEQTFLNSMEIDKALFGLSDLFKTNILEHISNKIKILKNCLSKYPNIVKKLNVLNGIDLVLTVSDIALDISFFKTSKEFNDNKNKH